VDLLPQQIHLKSISKLEVKTPSPLYVHFWYFMPGKHETLRLSNCWQEDTDMAGTCFWVFICVYLIILVWMSSSEDLTAEMKHVFIEVRSTFRMLLYIDNRLSSFCKYAAATCGKMNYKMKTNKTNRNRFPFPQVPRPRTRVPNMQSLEIYVLVLLYQIIGLTDVVRVEAIKYTQIQRRWFHKKRVYLVINFHVSEKHTRKVSTF
jgi:hypothetical protein